MQQEEKTHPYDVLCAKDCKDLATFQVGKEAGERKETYGITAYDVLRASSCEDCATRNQCDFGVRISLGRVYNFRRQK